MNEKSKKERLKNYKFREKLSRFTGTLLIGITALGGFFGYQAITNYAEFREQLETETFMVVDPESVKLNPILALPILIGGFIFLVLALKKNRDALKGRLSLGLLITIGIFYLIYSIAVITIASLAGAFIGSTIDEMVFVPLAKHYKICDEDQRGVVLEVRKERARIKVRKELEVSDNGSV